MAKWTLINIDKDTIGQLLGATFAMKVPGGMIVRNVVQDHGVSMVFVPDYDQKSFTSKIENLLEKWIGENKIS